MWCSALSVPVLRGSATPHCNPLSSPGTLVPTSAGRSCSDLASAELLEALGSSELPTENWSLIIARWCHTSRELEQPRLAGRGHRWLPAPARAPVCSAGRATPFPGSSSLAPSSAPPAAPAAADGPPSTLQGFPATAAWLTALPKPLPVHMPGARGSVPVTGFGPCGKPQNGQDPLTTPLDEHLWDVVACPPPALIPLPYFPLQQALLAPEHPPATSLIPPGISQPGSHPSSPSSQESEHSWKLCCCLLE